MTHVFVALLAASFILSCRAGFIGHNGAPYFAGATLFFAICLIVRIGE